ncbi:MAG: DUF763 domain-containing protein [Patescibacteria group bacterium]|nr:DUF763 domain-containing protein [Patescibacteria group bacterium]
MKTGIATFSLDTGRCPQWLFRRMKKLAGIMSELIIEEFGADELLKRLADPIWFQSFGCALAFDWNSSGLTITTTAALKEALREKDLGIYVCGGKGKTSRKTPNEIFHLGEKLNIDSDKYIKISKITAKVDNSLIQDGFNLYHHSFILTNKGNWVVIQQGMNIEKGLARRYHWCNLKINDIENFKFDEEPHSGIISDMFINRVLNLTDKESQENKKGIIKILNEENNLNNEIYSIFCYANSNSFQKRFLLPDVEFHYHPVIEEKFDRKRLIESISKAKFFQPKTIEDLLMINGVGPKTIRALSLISEIIYRVKPSYQDPARYTFAHGGKDGIPFPVDRKTYDEVINFYQKAIKISKQQKFLI